MTTATSTQGARKARQTIAAERRKAIADAIAAEVSAIADDLADFADFAAFLDDETGHLVDPVVLAVQASPDMSCAVTDRLSW